MSSKRCYSGTKHKEMVRQLMGLVVVCLFANAPLHAADKTVKILVLAGQSNMEGIPVRISSEGFF